MPNDQDRWGRSLQAISLFFLWAGSTLLLYWIGIPSEWHIATLALFLYIDFKLVSAYPKQKTGNLKMAFREKSGEVTRPAIPDNKPEPTAKAPGANTAHQSIDMPEWKKPENSILRVPAPLAPTVTAPQPILEAKQTNARAIDIDPLSRHPIDRFTKPSRPAQQVEHSPVSVPDVVVPIGPQGTDFRRQYSDQNINRTPQKRANRGRLRPEDYSRNLWKVGYLYLARNSQHWTGLHKLGQTTHYPTKRVDDFNKQQGGGWSIGRFELLEVVEVVNAYGAEQVLFEVLNDLRPVDKREFFIAEREYLYTAMRAAADFFKGKPDALNQIYEDLDPQVHPAWPGHVPTYYHHGVARGRGWVFLARNRFHLEQTYRFGVTTESPHKLMQSINIGQKNGASKIGFFTVVFCAPVWDTRSARSVGWNALSLWKLKGSRSYVRGDLEQIISTLVAALRNAGS